MFRRHSTLILLLLIFGMFFAFSNKAEALTYTCKHDSGTGIGCGDDWYCSNAPGANAEKCLTTSTIFNRCTGLTPATITIPDCASTDTCGICTSCTNETTGNGTLCGTYPSTSCVPAYSGSSPIANCGTYTADCSTTNVCNTCVNSNYTKCDSGARCQLNRTTSDAPVIANCTGFNQCAVGQPCSSCASQFALCSTTNTCVSNPSANLCASLVNCTTGQCASCVSGASRCAATNTCVADKTCPSGQTFDPCATGSNYCTGTANSLKIGYDSLRPDNFLFNSSLSLPSFTIPPSGYVGINTTTPSNILSVSGGNIFINDSLITSTTTNAAITKGYLDSALSAYSSSNSMWQLSGNNLFASSTAWNVGIGTTSPLYKLDVSGAVNIFNGYSEPTSETGYRLKFADNGGVNNDSGIGLSGVLGSESLWINKGSANGNIRFMFGTLGEKVTFTSGGSVGIGTTTPSAALDIFSKAKITSGGIVYNTDSSRYLDLTGVLTDSLKASGDFYSTAGELKTDGTGINYMLGSLGVGTNAPGVKLDVQTPGYGLPMATGTTQTYGGFRISPPSAQGNVVLDMGTGGGTNGAWLQTTLRTGLGSTYPLLLNPNGGNIGIGTNNPIYSKLQVAGDIAVDSGNRISPIAADIGAAYLKYDTAITDARFMFNGYYGLRFDTAGGTRMVIKQTGEVGIGTATPGAKLQVEGTFRVSNSLSSVVLDRLSGTGNRIVMTDASGSLYATSSSIATGLPIGTAGQTLRSDGTNWLANSVLYNNGTNIGIGTTIPNFKLDVIGDIRTSGVLTEKKVVFTPTTVGWYRIAAANGPFNSNQGGVVKIYSGYDNNVTDVEIQYNIGGYGTNGAIQQTRYSSYNSGSVSQTRISSDGSGSHYLDIYVSSATTPGPITIYGYGLNMPNFIASPVVGAVAGSTNVNTLTLGHGFRSTAGANFAETGGSVGIGTAAPSAALDIFSKVHITSGGTIYNTDNSRYLDMAGILTDSLKVSGNIYTTAGLFKSDGAGTNYMLGNLALGTTSASVKLAISGGANQVINVGGGRIGGLAAPQSADEAVPLSYLSANYLATSSDSGVTTISLTATTYNGSLTYTGGYTGYDAGNKICNAYAVGSHYCRTDEILYLVQKNGATGFTAINGDNSWIADGPPGFTGAVSADDCGGWTDGTNTKLGHFWMFNNTGGGRGSLSSCDTMKKLACCK